MPLPTQPYKGARDFYPEDKRLQKFIFNKLRQCVERYGYEEYDAPILEPLDIYLAKTGDEIVNEQTYQFEDRGGRKVVIRPEMTPSVSRMVAAKRQELVYPLRWYSLPNLWRYERPQRGRLREHWQLNVDIFGVNEISAEVEMVQIIDDIFKSFGANADMYEIRLNHRQLTNFLLQDQLGLNQKAAQSMSHLIDKQSKLERGAFITKIDDLLTDGQRSKGLTEKILEILAIEDTNDLPEGVRQQPAYQELNQVLEEAASAGIANVRYDVSLMRGFDYYTGVIFEVYDKHPDNNRSMLGGGRYDGLVGLFGVQPVPTVGFGWGDVTLSNFLELHHLLPELSSETDLYVALIGIKPASVRGLVAMLRAGGLNVAIDLSGRKIGDQLKAADKKGIQQVLIVGEAELAAKKFKLKQLASGKEQLVTVEALIKKAGK